VRGIGAQCNPDLGERSLRHWLTKHFFGQTLRTRLESATHAEMWGILAAEYPDWAPPLLWLAERVLCLPDLSASEAHSERTISQVRRVLGRHAVQPCAGGDEREVR
jgi:hypothetical protein